MSPATSERSANETAFRFTRAGIGAGLPPGLAEDLGRVAVSLRGEGHDPDAVLATALQRFAEGRSVARLKLEIGEEERMLGPEDDEVAISVLFVGPVLADWLRSGFPGGPPRLRLRKLDAPLLAAVYARALAPEERDWTWWFDAGVVGDLIVEQGAGGGPASPTPPPADDPVAAAALVDRYFQRSLVPASAQSRAEGAGAGLVDRD